MKVRLSFVVKRMQDSDISVSQNPDDNAGLKSLKTSDFLPLEHCGLDPLFHVFNQMYIKDLLNMDEYPTLPGAFAYKNHPIFKVDILGVVVKVDNKSKLYHYGVDDGTGVILCCIWKENYNCPTTDISELNHHLPSSLANKVEQIQSSMDMEFKLGDLIHVRGKITTFQNIRQITANFAVCIDDCSSEISRMVELPRLYKNIYNKPFQVPFQLEKEGKQFDAETVKQNIIESLVTILKLHLQEYREKFFDAKQILQDKNLQSAILEVSSKDQKFSDPQRSLDLALEAMEKTGEICRHQDKKNTYEPLFLPDSEMSAVILNLLQKEKQNTHSQNGCHIMKIFHQVKKTHHYADVSMASVRYCLDVLETNSDIIRTTDSHYIVVI